MPVDTKMATTWLVATGLFLLVSLTGLQCETPPSSFAVPFDVDGSGNAVNGDERINYDTKFYMHSITLTKSFSFGDRPVNSFYVS